MSLVNKILKEARLNELMDGSIKYSYTTSFKSVDNNTLVNTFKDEKGNVIDVKFESYEGIQQQDGDWIISFSFNGNENKDETMKDADSDLKHYIKILNTVVEIIQHFLKKYNPIKFSFITAVDKEGQQKYKIYKLINNKLAGVNYTIESYEDDSYGYKQVVFERK